MFAKPYRLKSNNTLKNSEKKHLVQRILESFPAAKEERVKELVPVKSNASCMKLVLHSGGSAAVFAVDNVPVMIDTDAGLVPTVCALWKVPELVPTIAIHTPVLSKILGGAPLYLPGVEIPHNGVGFPTFARGTVIAACTTDNAAAGVVGRAAIGSGDMLMRAAGVCLETLHVFGDQLCKDQKFGKLERPRLGPADVTSSDVTSSLAASVGELSLQPSTNVQAAPKEEWPALGRVQPAPQPPPPPAAPPASPPAPPAVPYAPRLIAEEAGNVGDVLNDSVASETMEEDEREIPGDMDGLLRWCLLCFLRLEGKSVELPLKTSLLYRNHILPLCPPGRTLDVKKSTYKKMSKFMEAMQREGLVEVKEIEKGVDAAVALHLTHPAVRGHRVPQELRERVKQQAEEGDKEQTEYVPPVVREMLCVTAAVTELFPQHKKGSALTAAQVRAALTDHVKARNLNNAQQRGALTLDALLARITGKQEQECVKWEAVMSGVTSRMTQATELQWADGETRLIKTRLEPITMQTQTRSGNKKVTLVNNLEAYGFNLSSLATACQRGVGASCGVTRSPGAKADQLMLQGDQTHFVAKLLVEKYGLPKKFVEGADKALSKKK